MSFWTDLFSQAKVYDSLKQAHADLNATQEGDEIRSSVYWPGSTRPLEIPASFEGMTGMEIENAIASGQKRINEQCEFDEKKYKHDCLREKLKHPQTIYKKRKPTFNKSAASF
jgi:hypothetical protein